MNRGLSDKEIFELLHDSDFEENCDINEDCSDEEIEIENPGRLQFGNCEPVSKILGNVDENEEESDEAQNSLENAIILASMDYNDELIIDEQSVIELINMAETPETFEYTEKAKIEWRRREFNPNSHVFRAESRDETVMCTPVEYFKKYFTEELLEKMAYFTNLYAVQKQSKNFKHTCSTEIKQFIALHIVMGCLKFSRIRLYWSPLIGIELFRHSMNSNRFFQLRTHLHFVNNLEIPKECEDKYIKVRLLIETVRHRCLEIDVEETLSIDEQIIPFKGRLSMKQYIKGKPNPWGFKVYILAGKSGQPYDFFLYQGSSTDISKVHMKKFGFAATTVLHLVQRLKSRGHTLFFDNFFTTYQVLEILHAKGINAAGTVRVNRMNKPPLLTDKELQAKGRGHADSVTSRDGKIVLVKWQDNKAIHIASNFVGIGNTVTVDRWNKQDKQTVAVNRPEIVSLYNSGMGGVDLLDQFISYYRIFIKSKKWTLRIFAHFLDFALSASWIEYKKDCVHNKLPEKEILDLLAFRMSVARCLIHETSRVTPKRGRPSANFKAQECDEPQTSKRRNECRPLKEVQLDQLNHLPEHDQKTEPTRCKSCISHRTHFMCQKCKVHLCITKNRNCFIDFHKVR